MTTPELVAAIRRVGGFSQEGLARRLGVSYPTVNAWERGRSSPRPRHLASIVELARVLGVEAGAFEARRRFGQAVERRRQVSLVIVAPVLRPVVVGGELALRAGFADEGHIEKLAILLEEDTLLKRLK